tara:strand:- start:19880 stop:21307 length:1428 start_codon:yes stop_codon:yes gene_type:complete
MKNLLFLVFLIALISSCAETPAENQLQNTTLDVHGKSQFTFINYTADSLNFSLTNWYRFPVGVQEFENTIAPYDTVHLDLTTQGFCYYDFDINEVDYKVFSAPNAAVVFNFKSDSSYYSNDLDSINNYLQKSSGSYYWNHEVLMNLINITRREDFTYQKLVAKNDEVVQKAQRKLINDRQYLPDWYVLLEHKRLAVMGAGFKLNSLSYRASMLQIDDELPLNYVESIMKDVPYLDEHLLGFGAYQNFMRDYRVQSFNPLNESSAYRFKNHYTDSLLAHTKAFIPHPFNDYALTSFMFLSLRVAKSSFKPEWMELISDTAYKNFLHAEFEKEDVLPNGAPIPKILAVNTDSSLFNPSVLKDSIILINFWASYCSPCIRKFPFENQLVEHFKGKPIKIINICIETDWGIFTYYTERYPLKTYNLFANPKVTKQLKLDFDISALPHSVLIDKNGDVVKNKYHVSEESTISYLTSLLEK